VRALEGRVFPLMFDAVQVEAEQIGRIHKTGAVEELNDLGFHHCGDLPIAVLNLMNSELCELPKLKQKPGFWKLSHCNCP